MDGSEVALGVVIGSALHTSLRLRTRLCAHLIYASIKALCE